MRTLMTTLRLLRDASIIALMSTATYLSIADMTKTEDIPRCYMHTEILETTKDTNILLHRQAELLHELSLSTAK